MSTFVWLACNTATDVGSEKVWEIIKSVGLKLRVSVGYHYMPLTTGFLGVFVDLGGIFFKAYVLGMESIS